MGDQGSRQRQPEEPESVSQSFPQLPANSQVQTVLESDVVRGQILHSKGSVRRSANESASSDVRVQPEQTGNGLHTA